MAFLVRGVQALTEESDLVFVLDRIDEGQEGAGRYRLLRGEQFHNRDDIDMEAELLPEGIDAVQGLAVMINHVNTNVPDAEDWIWTMSEEVSSVVMKDTKRSEYGWLKTNVNVQQTMGAVRASPAREKRKMAPKQKKQVKP